MNRKQFFKRGATLAAGASLLPSLAFSSEKKRLNKKARNIIFLVSDGMSIGTLQMADSLKYRKEGKHTSWINLYKEEKEVRALMDTASANSLVTDSAAASSSWGGGKRVNNGSLNVNEDGSFNKPILQKFKAAGKKVGCVTTVPITHATPAGFCINAGKRGNQDEIAELYLPLRFDVMMGGGKEFFNKRKDGRNLFKEFGEKGYEVVTNRNLMQQVKSGSKPLLGVFYDNGLPYSLDLQHDEILRNEIPTLAEMTAKTIELMKDHPDGFVMQVEGGKVDWAAHANDTLALLYDQIAFDDAVKTAIDFAEKDGNTLVIITTDHGNSNPALLYNDKADKNFEKLFTARSTNDRLLNSIKRYTTPAQIKELFATQQGIELTDEQIKTLLASYTGLDDTNPYNPYKLPFGKLGEMQKAQTSVGWAGDNHTGDYVELAMFGPGSELLKPFIINTDLHKLMLDAAEVDDL
jgi:alkaline phosphatase